MKIWFIDTYLHICIYIYTYTHTCCYIWKKHTFPIWPIYSFYNCKNSPSPPRRSRERGQLATTISGDDQRSTLDWVISSEAQQESSVWKVWIFCWENVKPCFRDVQQGGLFFWWDRNKKGWFWEGKNPDLLLRTCFLFVGGRGKSHVLMLDLKKSHPSLYS